MMRRCEETVPLLGPFLDEELDAVQGARLQGHLEACARCTERLRLVRATGQGLRERLRARAAAQPMDGFADGVFARIEREKRERRFLDSLRIWGTEEWRAHARGISASAGLAVAGCLALFALLHTDAQGRPGDALQASLAAAASLASPASPASIDELEFDDRSNGAILQLPSQVSPAGQTTTVIWMSDSGAAR